MEDERFFLSKIKIGDEVIKLFDFDNVTIYAVFGSFDNLNKELPNMDDINFMINFVKNAVRKENLDADSKRILFNSIQSLKKGKNELQIVYDKLTLCIKKTYPITYNSKISKSKLLKYLRTKILVIEEILSETINIF